MQFNLKDAYRFHRINGFTATQSINRAREDGTANKTRYPSSRTGWNPASKDGARWVESLSASGLRLVGFADDIVSLRHTGWYTDPDGIDGDGETLRGVVLQLPARHGCAQYLAAYADPCNKGAYRIDCDIIRGKRCSYYNAGNEDQAVRDAARRADSFAEHQAEEEREYNAAWRAGSDWQALGEDIAQHRRDALALIGEIKAARPFSPAICSTLRTHVSSHLHSIGEARRERVELAQNVWRDLYAAFNDGAGQTVLK